MVPFLCSTLAQIGFLQSNQSDAILTCIVTNDQALTALLVRLDSIAKAPMTGPERELRAEPLLGGHLTLDAVTRAVSRADLPWNGAKAAERGVPIETWLEAVQAVDLPASPTLAELLERLHRAEAAADLIKARYTPSRDSSGALTWGRP